MYFQAKLGQIITGLELFELIKYKFLDNDPIGG